LNEAHPQEARHSIYGCFRLRLQCYFLGWGERPACY
jgi:hypothetical protein